MRKQTSRIISMILSLAMLAAFVLAPLPVANAAATKTIYFDNSGYGWSAVYVYSWNGSGDCTGGWPGSAMTKVDGSIYSYEVPADAVNIIFTDNSGNQTSDLTIPTDDNNLFNGSEWSVYGAEVEMITVYFDNSQKGWSEVYAYAWTGNTPAIGAWPGTAMTLVKDSVYSVEIPAGTANVIFNNNAGSQTGDLAIPTDGNYYFGANEIWGAYPPAEEPTTPPATEPDTPDVVDFYLVGFINGANYGCEEDYENMGDYKFVDGKLTATFTADSYVFLKTTGNAAWYMAESYCISSGCFMYANGTEKLFVPGNVELEFTLMQFGDGSLHLSYTEVTYECSHDYTVTNTPPTCTEQGADVYTCTKCGDQFTNILGATGHSYASEVTTAATCTKTGVMTFTCSDCKDSYTEVIPANGHSYSNGKCTVCGTVDPNCDHSYNSEVTIAATCLEDGVRTYTCSKCGDVYTETIAATGHKYIDIVVPPTCENNGYTQHKCEYCGVYGINSDAVNPIGHNYSSVVTDPTCTEKGYTTYTCANCGNVYTWNETEPTGHNYVYGTCTTCGDVDASYVKAYYLFGFINGYNYGCEDDYENMGEYKFVDGQLTVTFETASYVGVKVTNNDAWYMAQSYCEDTTVTLYNTTTGAGEKLYVPGNTEVTFTLVENADDTLTLSYASGECEHLFSSYVETQPTCTTPGNRVNTCGYCGYSYDEPMDALGHTFENGLCLTCGAADPEYVAPDYYLFGYINGADYGWKDDIDNIGQYKFVDGKLSAKFTETSYVAVKTGDNAHFYMTNGYVGEVSSVALVEFADPASVAANRLYVPGGVTVDFTLSVNSQGSLVLSYTVNADDCSHADHNTDGICSFCGATVEHTYSLGVCSICGAQDPYYAPYDYYLFGYINGANYGCEEDYTNLGEYLFENGTLTATFASDSYVGVKEVNPGAKFGPEVVAWYMTDGWQGEVTSATLYNSTTLAASDKLFVPGNAVITFTMVKNEDGTVTLSYTAESLECKHDYVNGVCSICGAADPNYSAPDGSYVLVTDIDQITDGGNFVIVANNGQVCQAMPTTLTSGKFVGVDVTVNGQLVTGTDLPVWTIEAVKGGVVLIADGAYLGYKSTTNFATSSSSYTWTVAAGESGFIFDSAATTRGIYYQISSAKFGAYSTTNANASGYISNLQLYKYNGEISTECSHSYTEEITTAATCEKEGVKTITCTKCGDSYTESIAALDHCYTEEITTAATCEKAGVKTFTCSNCGDSYTESIAALGHSYVNGSCSNCGAQDPSQVTYDYYLFGYINGANYGCEEDYANLGEYLFENGTLTATFAADSYVGVKEVNPSAEVVAWYMTAGWQGEVTSVTLFDSTTLSVPDKLFVPAGVTLTFTLVKNENGTLTLSYVAEETECKHTYTAQQLSAATCKEYATYSLTCSECGDTETVSANELANRWLYAVPGGMSESTFENKTVYRYRDLAAVWNKTGVNTVYYVNSWPSGFDTSNVLYSQYNNLSKKVTASETDTTKLSVDSDAIIGYLYYHWCYEGYSYTVANKSGNYNRFHAYYSTKAPSEANSHDASDDSYRFDEATACADSNWYFYVPVYGQTYSTYNNEGGWGAWSAWSIAAVSASDTRQVESASMYRYTAAALVDHDYGYAITTEPTCDAYGVKTFTCIHCDDSYTETIAPNGHKYVEGYCTVCGSKDHDYVDPDDIPTATFYLVGYINGANYGCEEDYENMGQYKFVDGKLVATFETDSYVFLKTEGNANWYMSMIYGDSVNCNFYNTSTGAGEKMFVPGGVELTFTLTAMGNDSYLLSYTTPSMVCPHTSHNLDGICDSCGAQLVHVYIDGVCSCGKLETTAPVIEYYLFGHINGANYGCEEDSANIGEYKFVDGQITVHFDQDSYIGIKTSDNANWYMTAGWLGEVTTARLYNTAKLGNADKLFIPGGVDVTITMDKYVSDDSIGVSYTVAATEPSVAPTLALKYPTVSFEDVIVMNVYYTAENLEDVVEMGLITYSSNVAEWNINNAEEVITGYSYDTAKQMYVSSTNGIAAKNLGDTLYFAVYAKLSDGTYTYTKLVSYSPETYAYAQLSSGTAEIKALVVAMLKYGAAAQTFFGHNTDALVDRNLTSAQLGLIESYRADMMNTVATPSTSKQGAFVANGGITRKYPTVSFEGAFEINYYCVPANTPVDGVTMYYWNQADYDAASVLTAENATAAIKMDGTGTYQAAVKGIAAKDLDKGVYVAFVYSDGTTTYSSGVLAYSIGTYCNASVGGNAGELAKATAVYGYCAKLAFYKAA